MKKKNLLFVIIMLIATLTVALCSCTLKLMPSNNGTDDLDMLDEVLQYVESNYINGLNADAADLAAAAGVLNSLDRFSYLTTAVDEAPTTSVALGISFSISPYHEYIVSHVISESPAALAENENGYHIQRGDRVYSINGNRIEGLISSDFAAIAGNLTEVTLEVFRDYVPTPISFEITITKGRVTNEDCWYYNNLGGDVPDSFGYICLSQFTTVSKNQFEDAIESFMTDGNEYLILDLRDNPGGEASALQSIISYLITDENNSPTIDYLDIDLTSNKKIQTYTFSTLNNNYIARNDNVKGIFVLVNENTASAAEALSGAIRAFDTGVIIGCTTFGKGVAQTTDKIITDNTGIQYRVVLVTGKYYIKDASAEGGRYCLHEVGITPDIQTECEFSPYLYNDTDVLAAVQCALEQAE